MTDLEKLLWRRYDLPPASQILRLLSFDANRVKKKVTVKNPYSKLPDHCFWSKTVGQIDGSCVDPMVKAPFSISPTDRVATAGSCFAQHISRYIKRAGLNFLDAEPAHPIIGEQEAHDARYSQYSARYGNVYTMRQLLQLAKRAYNVFRPEESVWMLPSGGFVDAFRPRIQPQGFESMAELLADREQHLGAVRSVFEALDVFVFTVGLTESWESISDGAIYPLCPGVMGGTFDDEVFRLKDFSVAEIVKDAIEFLHILRGVNPNSRVIFTVSPVPLAATAMPNRHVVSASFHSKAILRVACGELLAQCGNIAYFPSFEIVSLGGKTQRYFSDDLRTVTETGVKQVMRVFLDHFADTKCLESDNADLPLPKIEPQIDRDVQSMDDLVGLDCDDNLHASKESVEGLESS